MVLATDPSRYSALAISHTHGDILAGREGRKSGDHVIGSEPSLVALPKLLHSCDELLPCTWRWWSV